MKLSVITPSLNQGQFLHKTIESVINQKGDFEIEHIVMDGGSTDSSVKILQETAKTLANQKRVNFIWRSEKDGGQSDAINKGLALAGGDIVSYLNSDDFYAPGALAKVVEAFRQQPNKLWLTGYCAIVDQNNQPINSMISRYKNFWLNHYSYNSLLVLNYISQPATFWRKTMYQKFGGFNQDFHLAMDYDYWLRIGANNTPIIIPSTLANFRVHTSSKGGQQYRNQFTEDEQICRQHTDSRLLRWLHRLHNGVIIASYRLSRN